MDVMAGRRVTDLRELQLPGDYCLVEDDDKPRVYFRLPVDVLPDSPHWRRSLYSVASPPHTFRECDDGSLEIRASIGVPKLGGGWLWHGYLDEGHRWRTLEVAA